MFDRLAIQPAGAGGNGLSSLHGDDGEMLEASIAIELNRLFNTRVGLDVDTLEARDRRSVIDYGIPDLSLFPPRDDLATARLVRHLEAAIAAFEPRLAEARVTILLQDDRPDALGARIDAVLTAMPGRRAVTFSVQLRQADDGD